MNINALNAYSNPYNNSISENLASSGITINDKNIGLENKREDKTATQQLSAELITPKERSFFKTLFPESSEQIDKHVLFNRNGKIQDAALSKGVIIDGRV